MKLSNNELLLYIFVALIVFSAVTIPALIFKGPTLDSPDHSKESIIGSETDYITSSSFTSASDTFSSTNKISNTNSQKETKTNSKEETNTNYNPPESSSDINLNYNGILYGIIGIAILILLYFIVKVFSNFQKYKITHKEQKIDKEKVQKIKDARTQAYQILKNGIETENYSTSFIAAYHALDENLEYFREIARPKYWTPKEYAFSVKRPIFRPSVYIFVKTFYKLRYGLEEAIKSDLEEFIFALDRLFIKDVSIEEQEKLLNHYKKEVNLQNQLQLPIKFDPTKPRPDKR